MWVNFSTPWIQMQTFFSALVSPSVWNTFFLPTRVRLWKRKFVESTLFVCRLVVLRLQFWHKAWRYLREMERREEKMKERLGTWHANASFTLSFSFSFTQTCLPVRWSWSACLMTCSEKTRRHFWHSDCSAWCNRVSGVQMRGVVVVNFSLIIRKSFFSCIKNCLSASSAW